jgi:hypothetical protein
MLPGSSLYFLGSIMPNFYNLINGFIISDVGDL